MSTAITMADVIIINTVLYNKITSIDCESNRIESNLCHYRSIRWVGENRFVMVAKQQNRTKQSKNTGYSNKSNVDRHALLQTTITFLMTFK